jgi:citrate (Re)-synthase
VDKRSEQVQRIAHWVDRQYGEGRTTSISDDEMAGAVRMYMPELLERSAPAFG